MPDMVSVQEFARKIRERRPDLGQIPDITLVGKTLQAAPELRQYVDLTQLPGMNTPPANAPDSRSGTEVMQDQAANVISGIPKAITGIPGTVMEAGGILKDFVTGKGIQAGQRLGRMAEGAVQPLSTTARGIGALAAPQSIQAPTAGAWEQAAQGAGANLGSLMLGEGVNKLRQFKSAPLSQSLEQKAAVNTAKSLRPVTLEDRAITEKIAPEMSRRGIRGITGGSIDTKLQQGLTDAQSHLQKVEARVTADPRPEMQVHMQPLVDQVDAAIQKLKIKGTDKAVNPHAVASLEYVRDLFKSLPEYADIDQVIDLRRKLDAAVDDAGGFRQSSSAADRITMKAQRGGADIARAALNDKDPALKIANQDFSFYRHANDVVERRTLGEVGTTGAGVPGRGNLLDDILAGWAGNAIGGTPGAALVEGINLARQTRGYTSMKAGLQQSLADRLRPPVRAPRALLTAGAPRLGIGADTTKMTVTTGKPILSHEELLTGGKIGSLKYTANPPLGIDISGLYGPSTEVMSHEELMTGQKPKIGSLKKKH